MKLPFQIAFRFLKSSIFQTIAIILGIAVGVSVQIFIGSLIGGLQKDLVDTTIGNSSQITIFSENNAIEDYEGILSNLKSWDDNIKYVSPSVDGAGSAVVGTNTKPILFRGFDFEKANNIYGFENKLKEGSLPLAGEIAIGSQLAESLGLNKLDSLEILIPLVGSQTLIISGIFDLGVAAINETWLISNIETAQNLLNLNSNQITSIEMQVKDVFKADETALNISSEINSEQFIVQNWKDQNSALLSGLQGQSTSSLMIQIFVMISVILGISSVLAITVMQKSKQIGILKAMGMSNSDASKIFLIEGFILGLFGAIVGVLLGLGLAYSFSTFALNEAGKPIINLFIDPQFILISALVATLASTFAALIPARKSSKLSIIEVIRNG